MKTRRKMWLVMAAMGVIAVVGVLFWPSNEPRYQGKTVSYWFKQYYLVGEGNETVYTQQQLDEVLHKLGTNALPYLVKQALSTSKDTAFRTNVYEWLGKLPASWHPPPFVRYDDIRQEAVEAIGEIKPSASEILPHVEKALKGPDEFQRAQALLILDDVEEGMETLLPFFLEALRSTNLMCLHIAVQNVAIIGPPAKAAVPDLVKIIKSGNGPKYKDLQLKVVEALGEIGPDAATAIPVLKIEFNSQTNWEERSKTAAALCKIDAGQTDAINYLIEALKSPEARLLGYVASLGLQPTYAVVAEEAAGQIGNIGTNARPAIPALIVALDSTNAMVMEAAAGALSQIGAARQSYLPKLEDKLKVGDEADRLQVARVILKNVEPTNQAAIVTMTEAMKEGSTNQVNVLYLLRGIDPPPKEIVAAIHGALASTNAVLRKMAADKLKEIEGK